MAKEVRTEILINATPDKVWKVLTEFEKYPHWNPFIKSITGQVKVGNKITVRIEPPGAKGMTFKPKVRVFDENKKLSWMGHLLFPGLFDGEHIFELIDNGNGATTFIQREQFKGLLVWTYNTEKVKRGFEEMNQKLNELAIHQQ